MIADRETVWQTAATDLKRIALFVLGLDVGMAVVMGLVRNGMPGLWELPMAFAAVAAFAITAPFHLGSRFSSARLHLHLFGLLVAIAGLFALALTYLGMVGIWAVYVLALASAAPIAWSVIRDASARRSMVWLALLVAVVLLLGLDYAGTKYSSFFADILALSGRTDGDQFFQGGLVASIVEFGFPTTAIDGLQRLHYHVGFNWITARVVGAVSGDPIAGVVASKIFLLVPLVWFAVGLAATIWRVTLAPHLRISPLAMTGTMLLFLVVATYVDLGNIVYESESMLTGAALGALLFPGALLLAIDREAPPRHRNLAIAACSLGLWPLAAAKISMSFVFAGVFGACMLLACGLRSRALWVSGLLCAIAFALGFVMFNSPGAQGAEWMGHIYYFEYGFDRGRWLLPFLGHLETIIALLFLWWLHDELSPARRYAICVLLAGAAVANIPVLLLRIEGGNAIYFLFAQAWLATTINVALFPSALAKAARKLGAVHRWLPAGVAALLIVGMVAQSVDYATWRFNGFVSASALLRTGDRSYYADDKRRVWRDDRKRALKEMGLAELIVAPPAPPMAEELADRLRALRQELGAEAAVFVPAENEAYWDMARDCDAKSLFPLAIARLPQIMGYYARQDACRQDAAWLGFPPPPAQPALLQTPEAVCGRAIEKGFRQIIWVDSMSASGVRVVPCVQP